VVLKAVRRWGVVVLRAEGSGQTGDCLWQLESAGGRKIKRLALKADAFVGPTEISHRELIAAGYPRDRIHRIVGGVAVPDPADLSVKLAARSALEGVNTLLHCPPKTPVAVYTGSLDEWTGPATAIDAWRLVTERWPSARLWLVGAEANQSQLNRRIEKAGLTGRVVIPGVFADVTELLAAADVAIIGDDLPESLALLLEAMAAGLPVAAADRPEHRSVLDDGTLARLYPPGGSDVLGRILVDLCGDAGQASSVGAAARAHVEQNYSIGKVADDHLRLLENLVRRKRKPSQS
jgi:glycosyltransferase involved in cell wall biosynthesis